MGKKKKLNKKIIRENTKPGQEKGSMRKSKKRRVNMRRVNIKSKIQRRLNIERRLQRRGRETRSERKMH